MQHRVACSRPLEQVLAGEKPGGDLVEVPVERGDVIDRLPADVPFSEKLGREKRWRRLIQGAVLGRLVEHGVAEFGLVRDHIRGEQARGKLRKMTVGRGHVEDAVAAVAARQQDLLREQCGRHLDEMAGFRGMVQGRVAGLVFAQQVFCRQDSGRQFAEPSIAGRGVQGGVAGGVGRSEILHGQLLYRNLKEGALADCGVQIRFFHTSEVGRNGTIGRQTTQTQIAS